MTRGSFGVAAMLVLLQPTAALACPVCFQMTDSAEAQGIRAAVVVLVGITIGVLGGIGTFLARAWRRMNVVGGNPPAPNHGDRS